MTLFGKKLCASFYGSPPHQTYWAGCSTGRQGHQMAQRYPEDFDGVLADAPAIMWTPLMMTFEWAPITMVQHNHFLTPCEINIFYNESIALCEPLDGVVDGIISNPGACPFNPSAVVGKNYTCDGQSITIGQNAADVIQSLHDGIISPSGRKMWTGYDWGTNWTGILQANISDTGVFGYLGVNWISTFLVENANYNTSGVNTEQLLEFWIDSSNRYGGVIDTSNPDLTPFRNGGGKLLAFHGFSDYAIPANNTLFYRNLVESSMGGHDATNEFYRLFFAPELDIVAPGMARRLSMRWTNLWRGSSKKYHRRVCRGPISPRMGRQPRDFFVSGPRLRNILAETKTTLPATNAARVFERMSRHGRELEQDGEMMKKNMTFIK